MLTKREPKQEHMPVNQLGRSGEDPANRPGEHIECDYCEDDAVWLHFASRFNGPNRNAYACNDHVGLLNPYYG